MGRARVRRTVAGALLLTALAVGSDDAATRQLSGSEVAAIVAPDGDVPFVGAGVTRSLDGTVTDADTVARQATEDAALVPPLPPPPADHQPLRPPVARRDFPDPSVIRAGDRYYAFSTNSGGRNVPVSSSTDLFHWTDPADALPVLPAWSGSGLAWAPAVASIGGRYVLYVSLPLVVFGGGQCVDRFVSDNPAGPYAAVSDGALLCNSVGGSGVIDPQPFVTGDGRVFLYWKSAGSSNRQIHVTELSADGLEVAAEPRHLLSATADWAGGGVENPTMVHAHGGWWLLYSANWWVDDRYRMGWAACDGPAGPCRKGAGPWLASRDGVSGPGGGSVFSGADGGLWLAYHSWGGGVGYRVGGYRQLHVEPIELGSGAPRMGGQAPTGAVDAVARAPGGLAVAGWGRDADSPDPVAIDVLVDGWPAAATRTGGGASPGFSTVISVAAGAHRVCVVATDDVGMSRPELGCADVTVVEEPFGAIDAMTMTPGAIELVGWAIDPDTAEPVAVDVYVDRVHAASLAADVPRVDVGQANPGYGDAHGWQATVPTAPGPHEVCVYAADTDELPSRSLGCHIVSVPA